MVLQRCFISDEATRSHAIRSAFLRAQVDFNASGVMLLGIQPICAYNNAAPIGCYEAARREPPLQCQCEVLKHPHRLQIKPVIACRSQHAAGGISTPRRIRAALRDLEEYGSPPSKIPSVEENDFYWSCKTVIRVPRIRVPRVPIPRIPIPWLPIPWLPVSCERPVPPVPVVRGVLVLFLFVLCVLVVLVLFLLVQLLLVLSLLALLCKSVLFGYDNSGGLPFRPRLNLTVLWHLVRCGMVRGSMTAASMTAATPLLAALRQEASPKKNDKKIALPMGARTRTRDCC